jgi:chromosome segregation ATPase
VLAVNDPDNVVDPVVLAERRARRAELAEEELRELLREAELGAATLKGRLAAVEGELATARAQRDSLAADLARREKELQAATRREVTEQALRTEAQTRAAETETGSRRELEELRVRLVAAEQRAELLTQLEAEVAERLERAQAADAELAALREELEGRQAEVAALREELERRAPQQAGPELDPELMAQVAAVRTAFAAQLAEVEHTVAQLRPRLGAALDALVERLGAEQQARAEAEQALAEERTRVVELQGELDAAASRHAAVVEVVAELSAAVDELRGRFAADLDVRVAELSGAADELRAELGTEQRLHSAAQGELERLRAEREAALAELEGERERRAASERAHAEAEAAHEEARTAHADAQAALDRHLAERDELAQAQAAHDETRAEVDRRRAELEQRRVELEQRQAKHIALQAELAREQAQHAAAQSQLGHEQERRAAAEAELARERERLEAAVAELEELRKAQPPAPAVDPAELERAAERLRSQAPPPPAEEVQEEEPSAPAPAPEERRDELARVLAAQQAAAETAVAPDPLAHLPTFPVRAVVPFAAGDGSWLREGLRNVGRSDPALGAELLLALTAIQAHAMRRPVAYQLTVGDAGTWRVELRDLQATIEPGASGSKVAFRVSGTAGELAALFAGGGRRKLTAHIEGRRLALWRLARARRLAPTLAQAVAAGGDFSLQAILALLGSVAPEGGRTVVAFDDGDSPITAVATRRGAVVLRPGIEQPQATLHGPEQDLVALLVGLAPAAPVRVSGDVAHATAFVTRLHRAQGLV